MILSEKYLRIAHGLPEKTKQRKAVWKPAPMNELGHAQMFRRADAQGEIYDFQLQLPKSVVRITWRFPGTTAEMIALEFLDDRDQLAGTWNVAMGGKDWALAYELYQEVGKQVNKWDKVLEEVEEFIGQS
jgi:hypothetical protein